MDGREHSQWTVRRPTALFRGVGAALALALALAAALPGAGAAAQAQDQVKRFNAALIAAMQGGAKLGFEGRYALIDPVARDVFDFGEMARIAAGGFWAGFDEAQRRRLTDAFARMSVATYAARFEAFGGERFELGAEQKLPRGGVMVANNLVKGDGGTVALNYLLRDQAGAWRVVDIMLDAKYSELAVKRSEYSSVLKSEGLDGLLARIEDRIRLLKSGGA